MVKRITMFRILGGEPLLYAELAAVLRRVLAEPGVEAVQIVTNGTLLPSEELIELLKNPKLSVQISDYGSLSCHRDELGVQIEQQGGKVEIWHAQGMWRDMGGLECRGRTTEELMQQLITCGSNCYSFFNGRINRCPRVSHGMDLGAFPDMPGDYVDMMSEGTSTKEKQRAIRHLKTAEQIGTCNYCDVGTERCVPTPTAEQMTKRAAE